MTSLRRPTRLERAPHGWRGTFAAMASPCEVLVDDPDSRLAQRLLEVVAREAWRIEAKFSRYRDDSVVHAIHSARGRPFEVDSETARLLDFAAECHALSEGRFDVTSGVLRRVWKFDGSDRVPDAAAVEALLPVIGWERIRWDRPVLVVPEGMEIDLGGLGKEYAVDRALAAVRTATDAPALVNFGGDLHVSGPRRGDAPWRIGIERLPHGKVEGGREVAARELEIRYGALATSGDARRFLEKDGVRYGHVLDPRTGWPVPDAPRSVTVVGDSCLEAGLLATLALLHGASAEAFLAEQGVRSWCLR